MWTKYGSVTPFVISMLEQTISTIVLTKRQLPILLYIRWKLSVKGLPFACLSCRTERHLPATVLGFNGKQPLNDQLNF